MSQPKFRQRVPEERRISAAYENQKEIKKLGVTMHRNSKASCEKS